MKDIKLNDKTILIVQGSFSIRNFKACILDYFFDNHNRDIKLKYTPYKKKKVYQIYRDDKALNYYLLKEKGRFKFAYIK